ncbi:ZPR1 zinc finger domain-containing protein [Promethearchaeum syntrophicum]|uniref:ZPR1 zinc finger domain-containing protein n=1 Tax=Promethearchaeum syntrophicum TaxID=2594042 RepID=A0A5B9D6R2_9ARCH|nr:ZPR1 zinc finger domain-containing protein [Candidatus Prometheoarchaeum syntrophicum]QEE14641.1 ZPR1 zinc-finger domain protein [Candidatus Prometheoarchaeum syntrophicum]
MVKKGISEKASLSKKEGTYELPEMTEDYLCPVCNEKGLKMTRTIYSLPDGDEVLIILLECNKCNYKKSDMVNMFTAFKPGEYLLTVDDGDFTHKVFRGARGDLEIPEIGMIIERGPAATFEFTNIEGIILKMKTQLEFFLRTTPTDIIEWQNANESLKRLNKVLSKQMPFKVILRDKEGGSYISPTTKEKMKFTEYKI